MGLEFLGPGRAMVLRFLLDSPARCIAAAAVASMLVSACAQSGAVTGPQFATKQGKQSLHRVYRLSSGDKIKVAVFGEENLSGQFEVNSFGQVSMPLIGEMPAKGLALNEFRDRVARRLSEGYLKNPRVAVEIMNTRPIFVHGEVKNGGEFQYKNGLTLRDAVAMAGGYTYRADQSYLSIAREGEPETAVQMPTEIPVLPGDNIKIPERFF
jgi:protein involved in polysaccharide export with SLBB domain